MSHLVHFLNLSPVFLPHLCVISAILYHFATFLNFCPFRPRFLNFLVRRQWHPLFDYHGEYKLVELAVRAINTLRQ